MKVLLLTTLYAPDIGANARIMTELAEDFTSAGHAVTVVTTHPHYTAGSATAPGRQERYRIEDQDGVRIVRVATYLPKRRTLPARALSFLSFMRAAPRAVRRLDLRADLIVAICPPLTTGFAAWKAGRRCRAPYIFCIQDLYPETAIELGYIKNPLLVRAARLFADFVHGRAARLAVISEGFREALASRGIPRERIGLLPNWVDTERFRPGLQARERLRRELRLDGAFVVLFAGTMGLAQGVEMVAPQAAEILQGEPAIAFAFLGGGLKREEIEAACARRGVADRVRFVPPQAHERMPDYLSIADAFLVHLHDIPLYRVTIPSKTYEYLAMGRPILMGVQGEAAALIERAGAGIPFTPESPGALADAALRLYRDRGTGAAMGRRGRVFASEHFSRRAVTGAFIREAESLVGRSRGEDRA
jgi:colanic acid biosynthesis glycosyl transferase WcaI